MPTIKQAQVPPANVKDMVPVPPSPTSAPAINNQSGLDERAIGPVPGVLTTAYDRVKQWVRPGTAQFRTFPLPPRANSQTNAATNSAVAAAAAAPSTTFTGMTFRGTWNNFSKYNQNDVAIFNKSAYIALQASINVQPNGDQDPPAWQLLSENLLFNLTSGGGVQNVRVQISAAQLTAADVTPIVLIPDPGPNMLIVPLNSFYTYNFVSAAYNFNANGIIGWGSTASDVVNNGALENFIDTTGVASQVGMGGIGGNFSPTVNPPVRFVHQPLCWANSVAISGGDATLTFNIQYVVINTLTGAVVGGTGNSVFGSKVELTDAQLRDQIGTTQIIPAAGANKLIVPLGLVAWCHFHTAPDASHTPAPYLFYGSNQVPQATTGNYSPLLMDSGALFLTADSIQTAAPGNFEVTDAATSVVNQPLSLGNGVVFPIGATGDFTATFYIQYMIVDTATGQISSGGSGDFVSSFANLSSAQLDAAYTTPVPLIPAGGANVIELPVSSSLISKFNGTPYSSGSGGVPAPTVGIGTTSAAIVAPGKQLINETYSPLMFTASADQMVVAGAQIELYPPAQMKSTPVQWADSTNLAGNTADSTGIISVQYLGVDLTTGKIVTGSSLSTFLPYDVISWNGSLYVCLQKTTNAPALEPASWGLLGSDLTALTALGDTTYFTGSSFAKLAGNTTTTKKYLSQTGTGAISAAPDWAQIAAADLSDGTLGTGKILLATSAPHLLTGPADLTGQSAAISGALIFATGTSPGKGKYRINYVATVTHTDTTSLSLGGTTGFQIIYVNANGDSVTKTSDPDTPVISTTNSTGTTISGCLICDAAASSNISYNFGYSAGTGDFRYDLSIVVEYLGS